MFDVFTLKSVGSHTKFLEDRNVGLGNESKNSPSDEGEFLKKRLCLVLSNEDDL